MIESEKHPLSGAPGWTFFQPYMNVHSSVFLKDLKTKEESKANITSFSHCREGLISDVRTSLQRRTTNFIQKGDRAWEGALTPTCSITLNDDRCLGEKDTVLSVLDNVRPATGKPFVSDEKVEEFLKVCNAIVGIPALLLNPGRKPGEWWRTDPKTAVRTSGNGRMIDWNGADNSFLQHPSIFASITGLLRQAFWICQAGFGERVLASADYSRVEGVLTAPSWKDALELAEQLRTWISVPIPSGGSLENISFPWYPRSSKQVSYWQRFIRLQRALHRHSPNEVFGGDFFEGWALLNKGTQYSGAFMYWGKEKTLTPAHKRVMELGKPKGKDDEAK